MTIIWTKGKSAKRIVHMINKSCNTLYRCCWQNDGLQIVDSVYHEDVIMWMENLPEGAVWQIDLGNSARAFGFNGTSYFG